MNGPEDQVVATGIRMGEAEKAAARKDMDFTVYHEIGHALFDQQLLTGKPVMKVPGATDQEAVALQDFFLGGAGIEFDESGAPALDELVALVGELATESWAQTLADKSRIRPEAAGKTGSRRA